MPTEEEITEKLEELEGWLNKADEEILESYSQEREDAPNLRGHRIRHGNQLAVIVGAADRHYFTIAFGYNVLDQLSQRLALVEEVGEMEEPPEPGEPIDIDTEVTEDHRDQAVEMVENKLNSADSATKSKMHFKCIQFLSNPDAAYKLHTGSGQGVYAFEVTRKEWVFEEDYGADNLSRGIQTVISIGMPARSFLQRSFGLDQHEIQIGTDIGLDLSEGRQEGRAYY